LECGVSTRFLSQLAPRATVDTWLHALERKGVETPHSKRKLNLSCFAGFKLLDELFGIILEGIAAALQQT